MKKTEGPKRQQTKYIFVTGGVLSGVGKGITAASIGAILKAQGYKVSIQKCDPYLNVDAGLLNPVEHGECFVTHDGKETDLDLGHYERFLDFETNKFSSVLSGALYKELIEKERSGGFHGKTVQMIPHFTNLVHEKIEKASQGSDIHIVEIGGTVGDYEGLSFIEAIRLFANRVGRKNCLYVHVVYVPWINTSKELKTKPAQNALKDLRGFGIIPDIVVCRTEKPAPRSMCEKIAAFSGIEGRAVLNLPDIDSVYDVPFNVLKSGVIEILNEFTGAKKEPDMSRWQEFSKKRSKKHQKKVKVGLVAKYVGNEDAYICVTEALKTAGAWNDVEVEIDFVNSEMLEKDSIEEILGQYDGLVVPGGFGMRGTEGKIAAADYALEHDIPYLGLCLGMQCAVIAAARRGRVDGIGAPVASSASSSSSSALLSRRMSNTARSVTLDSLNKLEDFNRVREPDESSRTSSKMIANGDKRLFNSEEFGATEEDENNVIYIMNDQKGKEQTGGTMRLGDYTAKLKPGSKVREIYGQGEVVERHRHRYEVNQKFLPEIEKGGIVVSGTSPDGKLVEFVEAPKCRFFVGTQAHPELKSRPLHAHPLFMEFIKSLKSGN